MGTRLLRALEVALRAGAGVAAVLAALWVLGPDGTQVLQGQVVPDDVRPLSGTTLFDWTRTPTLPVDMNDDPQRFADVLRATGSVAPRGEDGVEVPADRGFGELHAQMSMSVMAAPAAPRLAYVGLQVATLAVVAWVLWSLAGLVASSRGSTPFTARNARLVTRLGIVVGVGSLLGLLADRALTAWIGSIAYPFEDLVGWSLHVEDLPYGALLVSACLLSLGVAWRRGVALADDVEGLV